MRIRLALCVVGLVVVGLIAPRVGFAQAAAAQAADPTLPPPPPAAAPAPAASGTVFLKNGGFVRGELIELQPGVMVRVKLADGTVRDVPWAEVDHVTDPTLPPPAPSAGSASGYPAAELSASPPLPSLPSANAAEITRLRNERDSISNGGPIVMMVLGGGAFVLLGLTSLVMLSVGEVCDNSYDADVTYDRDCDDVRGTGAVVGVVALVGGGVAIWGLIKIGNNRAQRNILNNKIKELNGGMAGLSLDILPRKDGAALGLTLRL